MIVGRLTKDQADVRRVTVDFTQWLDAGETVVSATVPVIDVRQQASWSDGPYIANPPPVVSDTTPLTLLSEAVVNGNTGVQLFLQAGTPSLTYVVSFIATGGSGRQKEIDILVYVRVPPGTEPAAPGSVTGALQVQTSSFSLTTNASVYLCDTTLGAITATMPPAPTGGDTYTIKDVSGTAATNPITVNGGVYGIEGGTSVVIADAYGFVNLLFTGSKWVQVGAQLAVGFTTVVESASFLVETPVVYLCNTTAGPITATLPSSPSLSASCIIKDGAGLAGTNPITISAGAATIEGNSSVVIDTAWGFVSLFYTGSKWVQL